MSTRTIGVVGAGSHLLKSHLPFIGDVEVSGIYDPNPDSHAAAGRVLGYTPSAFKKPEELVSSRPDAILIGSPDKYHPAQLALVIGAGIPVLCEKPLAVDSQGLAVVNNALSMAAGGLFVASCHQRRSAITDLPYGWVRANLPSLEAEFGPLGRIGLSSIYPQPREGWKHDRSFLADKFVHDIDYLRILLGNGMFQAWRLLDDYDHYVVNGYMAYGGNSVNFACEGTRLHGDHTSYIEYVALNFQYGTCVVYTKTGMVRYYNHRTGQRRLYQITPMTSDGYDRVNSEVTQNFLNGNAIHTLEDLWTNTAAVVELASSGEYSSAY